MEDKPEISSEPSTIKALLEQSVLQTNRFDEEADTALYDKSSPAEYRTKLRERATVIAELPDKIQRLVGQGESIPENELVDLRNLAFSAREALEGKNDLYLAAFLSRRGSKVSDPNLLEEILERLYPHETSK